MPSAGVLIVTGWPQHHGMVGITRAATSVVIGHVAGGTSTIRPALRRNLNVNVDQFPQDVMGMINYPRPERGEQSVRAVRR